VRPAWTWALAMELFLNVCWLSLMLPAYLLWRQRTSSAGLGSAPAPVFVFVLGSALVLLFPAISASDDLHAMRPAMVESERAFRHAGHCASTSPAVIHSSQLVLPSLASLAPEFEQTGSILELAPPTHGVLSPLVPAGRAPPLEHPISL
jgi:hypothetical protein